MSTHNTPRLCAGPQTAGTPIKFWNVASIGDDEGEITLYGDVVSRQPVDWWTGEPEPGLYIAPESFMEGLAAVKGKSNITIKINSRGGDLFSGFAIHNAIKGLTGHKVVVVEGIAASAASVIACDVSGVDLTAFVARMNARAKELGCTDTTFTCVHGLYDYGNVSSAEDLAKLAAACYANETYMQAANTLTYTLPATNLHQNERTIKSTNLMLDPEYAYYRDYIRGMKTGFTTLAGRCFVTFAQQDGHTYGLVVLGSDLNNIYRECSELLDWAFSSFADRPLVDTETVLTTLPLTKCRTEETVELYAANDLSGYGHADDEVTFDFSLPESAAATIKEGAVLGTATVYLDGYEMGTVDLVTHREYVSDFRTDAKTTLLLMAALVGILIVLGFLTMVAGGGSLNLLRRNRSRRR